MYFEVFLASIGQTFNDINLNKITILNLTIIFVTKLMQDLLIVQKEAQLGLLKNNLKEQTQQIGNYENVLKIS